MKTLTVEDRSSYIEFSASAALALAIVLFILTAAINPPVRCRFSRFFVE